MVDTPFDEREGQFSDDSKWIAYQSDESGRVEVYVQPFPRPGGKWQISTNGGAQPRWRRDGKELFYISLNGQMMAAPIPLDPKGQAVEPGTSVALFPRQIAEDRVLGSTNKHQYAVTRDGQRFLIASVKEETASLPIMLVLNWKPPVH